MRVKDVDFEQRQIVVRDGKGEKDRVTMLPENVVLPLQAHLAWVRQVHAQDLAAGQGAVYLPYALAVKYPNANRAWREAGSGCSRPKACRKTRGRMSCAAIM